MAAIVFCVFFMLGPVDMTCYFTFGEPMRFQSQGRDRWAIRIPAGMERCDIFAGELEHAREESMP